MGNDGIYSTIENLTKNSTCLVCRQKNVRDMLSLVFNQI